MGLFNWKKDKKQEEPAKKISEYNIMDPIDVDLDATANNSDPHSKTYSSIVAETTDYLFYSYGTGGIFLIRRAKSNPAEKVFFGRNYPIICYYKGYLFKTNISTSFSTAHYIILQNIKSGVETNADWLGHGIIYQSFPGIRPVPENQDLVQSVAVVDDALEFTVERRKSANSLTNEEHDFDTVYTLKVTFENGKFHATAIYYTESPNAMETSDRSSLPRVLGRNEEKHLSCKYVGREDECPNNCSQCAISMKTNADLSLSFRDIDKALVQYYLAVSKEPKFAEAWNNMGNAFGMKGDYDRAIWAFDEAISIDPTYGKALYGKAITLKKLDKIDEAMELTNKILEMYADPTVMNFKEKLIALGAK